LDIHLVFLYGTPAEMILVHSPPFPLVIYYLGLKEMVVEDKKGMVFALQQRERVRRVHLELSAACSHDLGRS
jgi:hypothetical protein